MAAGSGSDVAIFIGDGAGPEVFTKLGTFTSNELSINGALVDITNKGSSGVRVLLDGGGVKSYSMSGNGIFEDSADEEVLRSQADAQSLNNYEFRFSDGSKYGGAFQVLNYSRNGDHNGAEQFSCTFESSAALTFTS